MADEVELEVSITITGTLAQRISDRAAVLKMSPDEMLTGLVDAPLSNTVLTKREYEVLVLVAEGMTSNEIAGKLFIAKGTAKTHRANALLKLDAHTSAGAISKAKALGIL